MVIQYIIFQQLNNEVYTITIYRLEYNVFNI